MTAQILVVFDITFFVIFQRIFKKIKLTFFSKIKIPYPVVGCFQGLTIMRSNMTAQILKFFFEKITRNVISRKLQGFEPSHLEARFAILENTLTAPNNRVMGSLVNYVGI